MLIHKCWNVRPEPYFAAARNAMSDPRNLNFEKQPKNYAQLKAELTSEASGASGKTLYENIIAAAKQQVKELGCFVAGTLVHTQEGLCPIEQIKVGDYVLSKPESGEGEQSYQRVTQTFEYEDREVYFAAWDVEAQPINGVQQWEQGYAVVTGAHPFWVKKIQDQLPLGTEFECNRWMSIEAMINMYRDGRKTRQGCGYIFLVELADGRIAWLKHFSAILQHRDPTLGIAFSREVQDWSLLGPVIRFLPQGAIAVRDERGQYLEEALYEDDAIEYDYDDEDSLVTQSMGFLPMRRKVFNIEVENTHTYFVGEPGVWVHNISGIVEKTLTRNPDQ